MTTGLLNPGVAGWEVTDNGQEHIFIPKCCGCKFYFTVEESDGAFMPSYLVPCCEREKGRKGRPKIDDDGCIEENWESIDSCRYYRKKRS
jgi:hypothetical protein